jgi:hypothetical protein
MNSLPVISLVTTLVLGGTAIFLAVQNRVDAVRRQAQVDALERQVMATQQAPPASGVSALERDLLADAAAAKDAEIEALKATLAAQAAEGATLDAQIQKIHDQEAAALTPQQQKIAGYPAIAKVTEYVAEFGFVALDAGSNRQIAPGQDYHIRRDKYLIGKIRIGDSVEEARAIADVEPGSVPEGFTIQPGDEVIQYFP